MAELEQLREQLGGAVAQLDQIRTEQKMQGWQLVALTGLVLLLVVAHFQKERQP